MGLFTIGVRFILSEKGASYTQLSYLSLVVYPNTIKFIFAPIIDSFYFKQFGKRKTYIIPI